MRTTKWKLEERNLENHIESYTGMMSHEFSTPIQTSLMLIEVIQNQVGNESCLELLRAIKISLNMLLYLINDILDFKMVRLG